MLVIWDLKNSILEQRVRLNPFELCELPIATQAGFRVLFYIRAENLEFADAYRMVPEFL